MVMFNQSARVWLFHLKHLQGERGKLSLNTTRELCEYLADPLLAHVTKTFLRFFTFQTSTWGPQVQLKTSIQIDDMNSWVVLEDRRVFCCGFGITYILGRDGAEGQYEGSKGLVRTAAHQQRSLRLRRLLRGSS